MRALDAFFYKMTQKPIFKKEFFAKMETFKELENVDVKDLEMLRLLGLPIVKYSDHAFSLSTTKTPILGGKFCIVDIETNGSDPASNQIIEIGAVMIENGEEVSQFSSLVRASELPESIVRLTGITLEQLKDAPSLNAVLSAFRLFLKDAVFVAHNVNFDYYFISYALEEAGFGPLLNRRLDTIDLARKCIDAPKYGLSSLMAYLDVAFENHHRALFDAKATALVLEKSLENLPEEVRTIEELIAFSKPQQQRKKRKPKPTKSDKAP